MVKYAVLGQVAFVIVYVLLLLLNSHNRMGPQNNTRETKGCFASLVA